jgi:2-amino-4-hydroxy-6-hydroxymethyldihydropteridine diphosphokinase
MTPFVTVYTTVYLGLGSNQGDRSAHLRRAVRALGSRASVRSLRASAVYESEAHTIDPDDVHPDFLNAAVEVQTTDSPETLLRAAQDLEARAGRPPESDRRVWAPRPLDVDILVYGSTTRSRPDLSIPHPRLGERRFVLEPLADLDPTLRIPAPFCTDVRSLLNECPDDGTLRRTSLSLTDA